MKNKRVLMLDIDPQGNSTSGVGISKRDLDYTVYEPVSYTHLKDISDFYIAYYTCNLQILSNLFNLFYTSFRKIWAYQRNLSRDKENLKMSSLESGRI